jgi:hypothetical protein
MLTIGTNVMLTVIIRYLFYFKQLSLSPVRWGGSEGGGDIVLSQQIE